MSTETTEAESSPQRTQRRQSLFDIGKRMTAHVSEALGNSPPEDEPQPDADEQVQDAEPAEEPAAEAEPPDADEAQDVSEDEETEPSEPETSDKPYLTLTVDGQEVEVESEEEARSLAQKGAHYTQEMQKLREEQRNWQQEREQIREGLREKENQYASALGQIEQTFGALLGDEPDWSSERIQRMRQENPQQYAALRDQWDQLRAVRQERERIARERQQEMQEKRQEVLQNERTKLLDKKPEWQDTGKREEAFGMIRDYALSIGASEEELNQLFDHRWWIALHDAARFRQAQSTGKKKAKAAKSKTVEPGSGKDEVNAESRRFKKTRERLKQTGDVRDAGAILQKIMTGQE